MMTVDIHTWGDEGTEHYTLKMACGNCAFRFFGRFIKGYRAHGSYTCPNCGCSEARPVKMEWS